MAVEHIMKVKYAQYIYDNFSYTTIEHALVYT